MRTALEISSIFVDDVCARDPVLAPQLGISGSDHQWGDAFGPDGVEHRMELVVRYRSLIEPQLDSDGQRPGSDSETGSICAAFHSTDIDNGATLDPLSDVVEERLSR